MASIFDRMTRKNPDPNVYDRFADRDLREISNSLEGFKHAADQVTKAETDEERDRAIRWRDHVGDGMVKGAKAAKERCWLDLFFGTSDDDDD